MRKFKLVMVSLMLSAGALAGCSKNDPTPDPEPEHVHTYSTEWTSDETNHWHAATCGHDVKDGEGAHTFGNDGYCTVCDYYDGSHDDARVFTDEKLGSLKGVFYSGDSVYTISKDGVVVLDGDEKINLQNDTIKGSGFSTVVNYKGPGDVACTLKWKRAKWDGNNFNLMLPTLVAGENEVQLQPAIDSAQGWYDGWEGSMDFGLQIYIVTNDFNVAKDAFQMYTANFSYDYISISTYVRTSFVKIGDKLELALSWFDEEDMEAGFNYSDWNYYLVKGEDGRLVMADLGENEGLEEWWTRPSFFLGEFIQPSSKDIPLGTIFGDWSYDSYSFWCDEDAKTVSVNYGDELPYVEGYDEYGAYVLIDGAKYRGTSYGITVETAEGVEECPMFVYEDFDLLQWYNYISGNNSIAFVLETDWDTWETEGYLEIDGVKADNSYLTFVENMVAIGADVGEDKYFLIPYDGTDAVLVGKNESLSIYVDDNKINDFLGTYLDPEFKNVIIGLDDQGMYIRMGGESVKASLAYNNTFGIVVSFGEDGMFIPLEPDKGLYGLASGDYVTFVFESDTVMSALGEWTSGKSTLNFSDELKVNYDGVEYDMLGLQALRNEFGYLPVCVFGNQDLQLYATIDPDNIYLYALVSSGYFEAIDAFVRPAVFATFYGEYNYVGTYGLEKISLASDGTLVVTTMNETGDGIIDKEYDYTPFATAYDGYIEAGLAFEYKGVEVDIYFDGVGHCNIFDVIYLAKVFFNNQGLYGSTSASYLSIVDNEVFYNGTEVIVTSLTADTITGSFNNELITISFSAGNATVTVGEAEPVVISKNPISVASFACDVKENVGNLGEDIKVTSDGKILVHYGYDPEDVWSEVKQYTYVIDAEGNVSIEFEWKMAYKYTITIKDGQVVITGESSLIPIPPPLPF